MPTGGNTERKTRVLSRLRKILGTEPAAAGVPASRRRDRLAIEPPHPVVYAVGDVHGCLAELAEAEARIVADPVGEGHAKLVVLLGDYVDRGPNSAGVLDYLLGPAPGGIERVCLCGNHDDAMADFVRDPAAHLPWLDIGGLQTLHSYGIDPGPLLRAGRFAQLRDLLVSRIPATHLSFIDALPVYVAVGDVLFVHAGVDPGRALEDQRDGDMMWIREPFITNGPGFPMTVVHGHTPSGDVSVGPGRIGIDTGAYMTGRLTVLRVHEGEFATL